MGKPLYALLLSLLLSACSPGENNCSKDDKQCLVKLILSHEIRRIDYWKNYFAKPVNKRVFQAPNELIDYIDLDNRRNGFRNKPRVPIVDEHFLQDVRRAITEIPVPVKNLIDNRFAGVFLIENLGGTGFTDYILDDAGAAIAGFVVLDSNILKSKTANEWASWKEATPFIRSPSYEIEAIIETEEDNNIKNAVQYILLHELGHILSINRDYHPRWTFAPNDVTDIDAYPYFNFSWRISKKQNKYISKYDDDIFPERDKVTYYFGARLGADQMLAVYNNLEKTDFVTLYAATSPADDWAESFVTYVHSVLMNKPFSIYLKKTGEIVKSYNLCWGDARCAKKEAFMRDLIGAIDVDIIHK